MCIIVKKYFINCLKSSYCFLKEVYGYPWIWNNRSHQATCRWMTVQVVHSSRQWYEGSQKEDGHQQTEAGPVSSPLCIRPDQHSPVLQILSPVDLWPKEKPSLGNNRSHRATRRLRAVQGANSSRQHSGGFLLSEKKTPQPPKSYNLRSHAACCFHL